MTIKQLPDFAFRSATDYAAAIDDLHARYDPVARRRRSSTCSSGCRVFSIFRSAWFSAGLIVLVDLDRRLHARPDAQAVARRQRRPGRPARAVLRPAAAGPRGDDRRRRRRTSGPSCGATASTSARRPQADGHALPVRRPPPVHEDGDAAHPHRAGPLPGRRRGRPRGSATSRAWSSPEGESLTVQPIGTPGLLLVKNLDFEAPGFDTGQADRLHDRPRGLPGRPGDRAQDDPGQRPAVDRAATRSTRTGSGRRRTCRPATRPASRCGTRAGAA